MFRRHDDPVEVRTRVLTTPDGAARDDTGQPRRPGGRSDGAVPAAFLWRGRVYLVREVLGQWYDQQGPVPAGDAQVWRVEAAAGRSQPVGVYDLRRALTEWRLLRASD